MWLKCCVHIAVKTRIYTHGYSSGGEVENFENAQIVSKLPHTASFSLLTYPQVFLNYLSFDFINDFLSNFMLHLFQLTISMRQ